MPVPNSSTEDFVFRPRGPRVLAAVLGAGALAGAAAVALGAGPGGWPAAVPLLLLAYLAWWLFWFPSVTVGGDGVRLVNPASTVSIPWEAIVDVDTKYALTVVTPKRRYGAWAAPAPGSGAALREARRTARTERRDAGDRRYVSVRPGDVAGTDSGTVAAQVRRRLQALAEQGRLDGDAAEAAVVRRQWHGAHLLAFLLLLALSLLLPSYLL